MSKIDVPVVTSNQVKEKRYVDVPQKDLFDYPFPTIRINLNAYGPGKHYVDEDTAIEIEDRVKAKMDADIRIMQPRQDTKATGAMSRWGSARGGNFASNPDAAMKD